MQQAVTCSACTSPAQLLQLITQQVDALELRLRAVPLPLGGLGLLLRLKQEPLGLDLQHAAARFRGCISPQSA
jgi:hypothetical protein